MMEVYEFMKVYIRNVTGMIKKASQSIYMPHFALRKGRSKSVSVDQHLHSLCSESFTCDHACYHAEAHLNVQFNVIYALSQSKLKIQTTLIPTPE